MIRRYALDSLLLVAGRGLEGTTAKFFRRNWLKFLVTVSNLAATNFCQKISNYVAKLVFTLSVMLAFCDCRILHQYAILMW